MIKYRVKIRKIIEESEIVKTFILDKPEDLTWDEGAHMHLGLPGFDSGEGPNKSLVHHLSIMNLPEEGYLGFTTRIPSGEKSIFKTELSKLKVGDEVTVFKIGSRMKLRRENRPIVLLSQGIAQATMRPLILKFAEYGEGIEALINVNIDGSGNFTYIDELENFSDRIGYYLNNSRKGFYYEVESLTNLAKPLFYVVGSDSFVKEVVGFLLERNVDKEDIVLDMKEEKIEEIFA